MGKADRLSRRLDWEVGTEKDNNDQIIIKDNWLCKLEDVIIEGPEVEVIKKIKNLEVRTKR